MCEQLQPAIIKWYIQEEGIGKIRLANDYGKNANCSWHTEDQK